MADKSDDRVQMVHPDASPDTAVEVSRHEYESVWKAVGWKLQSKKTESKEK